MKLQRLVTEDVLQVKTGHRNHDSSEDVGQLLDKKGCQAAAAAAGNLFFEKCSRPAGGYQVSGISILY